METRKPSNESLPLDETVFSQKSVSLATLKGSSEIYNDLSLLGTIALNSTRKLSLVVIEDGKGKCIRPFSSILLRAPIGNTKSTFLNVVASHGKKDSEPRRKILTEITRAGLVGTIDTKTQTFIPGYAWTTRKDIGLLDEFNPSGASFYDRKDAEGALLQLLEDGRYEKKIGVYVKRFEEREGDSYCIADNGQISVKTSFPCIIATMKRFERMRSDFTKGLVSRTIPYSFSMSVEEMRDMIVNGHAFEIETKEVTPSTTINDSLSCDIADFVKQILDTLQSEHEKKGHTGEYEAKVSQQIFLRTFGDCCRAYSIFDRFDRELFEKICKWKFEAQSKLGNYGD
jgi:hypothetical protein